ncbi:MAG: pirin family protein [Desulfatibacillaceae bacterium]
MRADQRHFSDFGWLKSFWLFSFSNYHDPANVRFGPLCAYNDEILEPGSAFPEHSHRDMEIVTLVFRGELDIHHGPRDRVAVGAGGVHAITSGTGVSHFEANSGDSPAHFHQLWITPATENLEPEHHTGRFPPENRPGRLVPVASGHGAAGALPIRADATVHLAAMEAGQRLQYRIPAGRMVFVYLIRGSMTANGVRLLKNDQIRLEPEKEDSSLDFQAIAGADFLLADLGETEDS